MKLGECFPGNWLKAGDLGDEDHVVTIKQVKQEMVGQGQQAQMKLVVEFEELSKALICNKTNATAIAKVLHSDDTDDWLGKRIILYVNDDVQFAGDVVSAIRVRSKVPPMPARVSPTAPNGVLTYQQAVALCQGEGIEEAVLKEHLKLSGFTQWNSVACTPVVRKFVASLIPPDDLNDTKDPIPF